MSCNHNEAIAARDKAIELKAVGKLFSELIKHHPVAVAKAWERLNLVGHRCHICGNGALNYVTSKKMECSACGVEIVVAV